MTILGPNDPRAIYRPENRIWWEQLREKQREHEARMKRDVQLTLLTASEIDDTLSQDVTEAEHARNASGGQAR